MERAGADIVVAGAGLAGLIAAAALADTGAGVLVLDPGPPPDREARGDLRSTALLQPAHDLLDRLGIWQDISAHATPLDGLRILDLAGDPPAIRTDRLFREDGGPLGWNFGNDPLRGALVGALGSRPGVEIRWRTGFARLVSRTSAVLVTLADGTQVHARLLVAADGRASPVREAAGIGVSVTRYGQKALAFAVSHPEPHGGISAESYLERDSFTTVPLSDADDRHRSAVVWVAPGPEAATLAALAPADFAAAATHRSAGILGPLALESGRAVWPVVTQRADALTAGRVALIAEAAHVLPPIGAQGLNTSVNDIAALADAIGQAPRDPGAPAILSGYQAARGRDIALRAGAVDLFNRLTRSAAPPAQSLRAWGLRAVHDIAPLRSAVIRAGMRPPG